MSVRSSILGKCTRPAGLLITLLVALSLAASCASSSVTEDPGRLVVSAGTYDLGIVIPGTPIARVLSLKNTGREALTIRMIRTSGRRLAVPVTSLRLDAGATREVPFQFRAEVWEDGAFREWIMIYSDDPATPLVRVRVQGGIQAPISWTPKAPMVGYTRRDKAEPIHLVKISARDRTPISPVRAVSMVPYTEARVTPVGPEQYQIDLLLDPDVPLIPLLGFVRIETAHPKFPELLLPVRGQVIGDFAVRPYRFDFGLVEEGAPATARVKLVTDPAHPWRVLRVEARLPLPAQVSTTRSGKNFDIAVSIPRTLPTWSLQGVVNVFTDSPREPVVQISAAGWVLVKDPFARSAREGNDKAVFDLLRAALFEDENKLPSDEIVQAVFGGVADDRVVALLLAALRDEHYLVRQRAAEVLGLLKSQKALEPVKAAVTDDMHGDVRSAAAAALVQIAGRQAVPTILLALQDDDDWVRDDAAALLGDLGDPRAIPALKVALKDESKDVRATAARSLKALAGESPGTPAPAPPPP